MNGIFKVYHRAEPPFLRIPPAWSLCRSFKFSVSLSVLILRCPSWYSTVPYFVFSSFHLPFGIWSDDKTFRFFPPAFTFCSRLGFCCSWILIKLGSCGIWIRKRSFDLTAPFRFLLKVAFLELPLVPYLWRFSFCAYTIPRRLPGVYSQNRQSCRELFVHVQGWIFHWHIWYN